MANLKISQVEKTTNMDEDAYVLVVQNGKNYRMSIKEAIAAYVDLSPYYTKEETENTVNDAIEVLEAEVVFRTVSIRISILFNASSVSSLV